MSRYENLSVNKLTVAGGTVVKPLIITGTGTSTKKLTPGVMSVEFAGTGIVTMSIPDATKHCGIFSMKCTVEPDTTGHVVTLTTGTWNGTNKVATFADILDAVIVHFDSAGNGQVILNTGSVAFSG